MITWSDVGSWLKSNAGTGATLVGSLLTGNVPGAVAAGIALVGSATGSNDPAQALASLQNDPTTMLKLRELAIQDEANIREHVRAMEELRLNDEQANQAEQQATIRSGDNAKDEYVRNTRPLMARQSWYATMSYIIVFEAFEALGYFSFGSSVDLSAVLIAPAAAYMGFRTLDKFNAAKATTK